MSGWGDSLDGSESYIYDLEGSKNIQILQTFKFQITLSIRPIALCGKRFQMSFNSDALWVLFEVTGCRYEIQNYVKFGKVSNRRLVLKLSLICVFHIEHNYLTEVENWKGFDDFITCTLKSGELTSLYSRRI
jgi:hypothetical protein